MSKDNYWFNIIVFGNVANGGSQDSGQMVGWLDKMKIILNSVGPQLDLALKYSDY